MLEMLIVRHLGTPNSDFNECHCMRDPVLYRSMIASCQCFIMFSSAGKLENVFVRKIWHESESNLTFALVFKVPMTPKFLLHDVKEYLKL